MKKSVLLLILAGALMVSACSTYTCPTYSKAPAHKAAKETRGSKEFSPRGDRAIQMGLLFLLVRWGPVDPLRANAKKNELSGD